MCVDMLKFSFTEEKSKFWSTPLIFIFQSSRSIIQHFAAHLSNIPIELQSDSMYTLQDIPVVIHPPTF